MMYWHDGSWGWAGWLVMIVSMLAFWGLFAWVAVAVVRSLASPRAGSSEPDPLEILASRFARGEIDEHEFRQRSEVLRAQRPGGGG